MSTVLVVEDNLMNLELIVQILEDRYEVVTARDGQQGLTLAAERNPDLIIMDISLPVLDGWQATRALKQDPGTSSIPVVALTAHAMPGDDERARAAGCNDVLTKPVDEDLLLETLDRHLGAGT